MADNTGDRSQVKQDRFAGSLSPHLADALITIENKFLNS